MATITEVTRPRVLEMTLALNEIEIRAVFVALGGMTLSMYDGNEELSAASYQLYKEIDVVLKGN